MAYLYTRAGYMKYDSLTDIHPLKIVNAPSLVRTDPTSHALHNWATTLNTPLPLLFYLDPLLPLVSCHNRRLQTFTSLILYPPTPAGRRWRVLMLVSRPQVRGCSFTGAARGRKEDEVDGMGITLKRPQVHPRAQATIHRPVTSGWVSLRPRCCCSCCSSSSST
jgi:hypothetical protein